MGGEGAVRRGGRGPWDADTEFLPLISLPWPFCARPRIPLHRLQLGLSAHGTVRAETLPRPLLSPLRSQLLEAWCQSLVAPRACPALLVLHLSFRPHFLRLRKGQKHREGCSGLHGLCPSHACLLAAALPWGWGSPEEPSLKHTPPPLQCLSFAKDGPLIIGQNHLW